MTLPGLPPKPVILESTWGLSDRPESVRHSHNLLLHLVCLIRDHDWRTPTESARKHYRVLAHCARCGFLAQLKKYRYRYRAFTKPELKAWVEYFRKEYRRP